MITRESHAMTVALSRLIELRPCSPRLPPFTRTRLKLIPVVLALSACGSGDPKYDTFGEASSSGSSTTGEHTDTDSSGASGQTTSDPDSTSGHDGSDADGMTTPAETTDTGPSETTGPSPSVCGDSIQNGDEECDDANDIDGDGCLGDCTREWFVFITSLPSLTGDLKGLTGADYQCRHRATKMFLPNGERYKAWISTSAVQPVDRLYHARGPYKLVNGLRVAANWDALIAGPLENPINITEMSEGLDALVYTGTQADGTRTPNSNFCDDWTDDEPNVWVGDSAATNEGWTAVVEGGCYGATLYCFEQP